jgi:DNA-binding MarR family transcriptional regulator
MDKVAVSRAVNRLIDVGRLRREVHGRDRRRSVLALTAKGRKVYDQVAPRALAYERRLVKLLDPDEQRMLDRILAKLHVLRSRPAALPVEG